MEKKNKVSNKINTKFNNNFNINIVFLVFFILLLFSISLLSFEETKLNIEINDYAETDIRATKDIVDEHATEELRQDIYKSVEPKYRVNPSVQMAIKDKVSNLFDTIRDLKIQTNLSNRRKAELLQETLDIEIENSSIISMLNMEYTDLNHFENTMLELITQLMGVGIREEDLEYEKANMENTFESLNLTDGQKTIGISLMTQMIEANKSIDEVETQRIRDLAVARVDDVVVKENEIIATQGEIIDGHKLDLIKESGLLKDSNDGDIISKIGIAILVVLGSLSLMTYVYFYNRDIIYNNRFRVLIIILTLTILLSRVIYVFSPNLIPVSAAGILISILINSTLGIIANIFLSLFLGIVLGLDTSLIIMLIIGGTLSIMVITYQQQRSNILLSGFVMAFANILVITSFGLIKGLNAMDILFRDLQVFLNGIISMILTIGSLPLWENLFSILTPIKLLELSNPNHPLLKRLLVEAPGTYHHSLMVGNLSEAAADSIGANSLLVRVGAYYHDIGKLYKPYYFKENQFGMANPHDIMDPNESVKIILDHVTEGIKLAKDNKLPKEIIEFIDEHHGTTTVAYFYYMAKENDSSVDIEDFRYKGKKPQTKETALVMLADSVEAAVRSIKEPSQEKVEDMVRKVVRGKVDDNQLDECDITNKDINKAIDSFIYILLGLYHDRIEYPSFETVGGEGQ